VTDAVWLLVGFGTSMVEEMGYEEIFQGRWNPEAAGDTKFFLAMKRWIPLGFSLFKNYYLRPMKSVIF
jgi:hypothetical protein